MGWNTDSPSAPARIEAWYICRQPPALRGGGRPDNPTEGRPSRSGAVRARRGCWLLWCASVCECAWRARRRKCPRLSALSSYISSYPLRNIPSTQLQLRREWNCRRRWSRVASGDIDDAPFAGLAAVMLRCNAVGGGTRCSRLGKINQVQYVCTYIILWGPGPNVVISLLCWTPPVSQLSADLRSCCLSQYWRFSWRPERLVWPNFCTCMCVLPGAMVAHTYGAKSRG